MMNSLRRRFAFVSLGALLLPGFIGCMDFSGKLRRQREKLLEERDNADREVRRHVHLFNERDQVRQELSNLEAQLELYEKYQKQREAEKK